MTDKVSIKSILILIMLPSITPLIKYCFPAFYLLDTPTHFSSDFLLTFLKKIMIIPSNTGNNIKYIHSFCVFYTIFLFIQNIFSSLLISPLYFSYNITDWNKYMYGIWLIFILWFPTINFQIYHHATCYRTLYPVLFFIHCQSIF